MNKNQIKISISRNSSSAMVAHVHVNEGEVFASSKGGMLACALHAMGVSPLVANGASFRLGADEDGTFFGHAVADTAEEKVFFGELLAGLGLLRHFDGGVDEPVYRFVRGLLPTTLLASESPSLAWSQYEAKDFEKYLYYPLIDSSHVQATA